MAYAAPPRRCASIRALALAAFIAEQRHFVTAYGLGVFGWRRRCPLDPLRPPEWARPHSARVRRIACRPGVLGLESIAHLIPGLPRRRRMDVSGTGKAATRYVGHRPEVRGRDGTVPAERRERTHLLCAPRLRLLRVPEVGGLVAQGLSRRWLLVHRRSRRCASGMVTRSFWLTQS